MGPARSLRVLVVATKFPWPPIDGGRLVLATTLEALAAAGVELTVVSPPTEADARMPPAIRHVPFRARAASWATTFLHPATPATLIRHTQPDAIATLERLLAERTFDLVHAEQLHSLRLLAPARRRGLPLILRAQNVESDLWKGAARVLPFASPWLRYQSALLRRFEGRAVADAAVTAALTAPDAERLRRLARGRGVVVALPAPFPPELPAGAAALPGSPALVVAAGGWIPNRDGARWFLERVWPAVRTRLPEARLHLFGHDAHGGAGGTARLPEGVTPHPAPRDSVDLFARGTIQVVPLRVASGVRMKILEAWARGVPVVATARAAAGLEEGASEAVLAASTADGLATAIETLARDRQRADAMVAHGRRMLVEHHDPERIAARWIELYRDTAVGSR